MTAFYYCQFAIRYIKLKYSPLAIESPSLKPIQLVLPPVLGQGNLPIHDEGILHFAVPAVATAAGVDDDPGCSGEIGDQATASARNGGRIPTQALQWPQSQRGKGVWRRRELGGGGCRVMLLSTDPTNATTKLLLLL